LPSTVLLDFPLPRLLNFPAHQLTSGLCLWSFNLSLCLETLFLHTLLQHGRVLKAYRLKATAITYLLTALHVSRVHWQWLLSIPHVLAGVTWLGTAGSKLLLLTCLASLLGLPWSTSSQGFILLGLCHLVFLVSSPGSWTCLT
jgi:hypothetical protein